MTGTTWSRLALFGVTSLVLAACQAEGGSATTVAESQPTTTTTPVTSTTATSLTTTSPGAPTSTIVTSREDAVPVGQAVQIGAWRMRVSAVTADGTDLVLKDDFNEPPPEGEQYFVATLEATYTGKESSEVWSDFIFGAVGETAVAYQSAVDHCGIVPDDIFQAGEVFTGGTIRGNVCWKIKSEDADSLVLITEGFLDFDADRVFLSLDPDAVPIDDTTSIGEPTIDKSDAVPRGETGTMGDWEIVVVETFPNANQLILDEAGFNEPPEEDHQYFMVMVEATYVGSESSSFFADVDLEAVGDSSVVYSIFNADCGFVPDSIGFAGEAFPGGTVTGNVCWQVRSVDVPSLVMLASEFGFESEERVMFALNG